MPTNTKEYIQKYYKIIKINLNIKNIIVLHVN